MSGCCQYLLQPIAIEYSKSDFYCVVTVAIQSCDGEEWECALLSKGGGCLNFDA